MKFHTHAHIWLTKMRIKTSFVKSSGVAYFSRMELLSSIFSTIFVILNTLKSSRKSR